MSQSLSTSTPSGGWGMARATVSIAGEKQVPIRSSAVFHREEGGWKLVQFHASVGVPNEGLLA
jgi:hypothetical protein